MAASSLIRADIRMLSGCEDAQTSADVSDVANFSLPDPAGRGGGACTSALLQVLYADHKDTAEDLSFEQVLLKIRDNIDAMGLSQIPQLSSSRKMDMTQTFHIVPAGSTGTRRAVMIGINYTGQDGELKGCQNDVKNMKEYLQEVHGFQEENITLMLDDKKHSKPTRKNITDAFKEMAKVSEPGDVVFCHFSGHGGKIRDFDGDEDDGFDETLVPVDFEKCGQIRDDYLFQKMVCPMKEGVTMTCLFDCCHSGTVLDLPYVFTADGSQASMTTPAGFDASKIEQAAAAQDDDNEDDSEDDNDAGEEVEEDVFDDDEEIDEVNFEEVVVEEVAVEDDEVVEEIVDEILANDNEHDSDAGDSEAAVEPEEETAVAPVPAPPPKRNSQPTKRPSTSINPAEAPPEPKYEPSGNTQEVFVKYGRESIIILADIDDKFLKIKESVEDKTGVPVAEQHIIYNGLGIKFKDNKSLRYYGCTGGAFLTMTKK